MGIQEFTEQCFGKITELFRIKCETFKKNKCFSRVAYDFFPLGVKIWIRFPHRKQKSALFDSLVENLFLKGFDFYKNYLKTENH